MSTERLLRTVSARQYASSGTGRDIRKAARLSAGEVARAIGVTRQTVSNWEGGRSVPRGEAGERWADLLDKLQRAIADPPTLAA